MRLIKVEWKNIKSFGNKIQTIEFPEEGALHMVTGLNGVGKCLSRDTSININIQNKVIREKFLKFLES